MSENKTDKPSNAAMRAAEKLIFISGLDSGIDRVAQIIDQETGLKELIEALENAISALNWLVAFEGPARKRAGEHIAEMREALIKARGET